MTLRFCILRVPALCLLVLALLPAQSANSQSYTLDQALSAPFASDLVASPRLGRFAWVEDEQGRRNVWMAEPNAAGKYESKRLTSYNQDDGQAIYD
ncbi:MAG TPA: hypothetical protein VJU82_18400, partial [Acidobacteriaceae bacterium]|nr:hypothetical protein [Acidobacteriaceae bacterium]